MKAPASYPAIPCSPARPAALVKLAAIVLLCSLCCSCRLVYKNSLSRDGFVVYSNDGQDFLEETGSRIENIYTSLAEIFDIARPFPWTTRIFLEGQSEDLLDYSYAPDLLGYYVPFLQVIHIDTRATSTNHSSDLDQVLLHEISHHFLVSELPGISDRCWLNEGLAGNLEVGIIGKDRAEFPLLNPILLGLARREITANPDRTLLPGLLESDWKAFHNEKTRERNYALSWALVYFLLTETHPPGMPLGRRIKKIHRLEEAEIISLEANWRKKILELHPVRELYKLACNDSSSRRLSALWAIEELGKARGLNARSSLAAVTSLFEKKSPAIREAAYVSFLQLLTSNPQVPFLEPRKTEEAVDRLKSVITDGEASPRLRSRIVANLEAHRTTGKDWVPLLVDSLEDPHPGVRAAAAGALAKMAPKPTILRPAFWSSATLKERTQEIDEWKSWLAARKSD